MSDLSVCIVDYGHPLPIVQLHTTGDGHDDGTLIEIPQSLWDRYEAVVAEYNSVMAAMEYASEVAS